MDLNTQGGPCKACVGFFLERLKNKVFSCFIIGRLPKGLGVASEGGKESVWVTDRGDNGGGWNTNAGKDTSGEQPGDGTEAKFYGCLTGGELKGTTNTP